MGCHVYDMPFWALNLGAPKSVVAEQDGMTDESPPKWSIITYEFPERRGNGKNNALVPAKFVWYDGGKKPSPDLVKGKKLPTNGVILVGDTDTLYVPSYWGKGEFLSGAKYDDFKSVAETLPKADNFDRCHYEEWIAGCKGGPKPYSNFDNSGPLTEMVLLGNVALRAGKTIEWDAKRLKVTNDKSANQFLTKKYRKGWGV
jgi:hypothetical protein